MQFIRAPHTHTWQRIRGPKIGDQEKAGACSLTHPGFKGGRTESWIYDQRPIRGKEGGTSGREEDET